MIKLMKNYPKITAAIVLVFVLVISIIVKQLVPLFVNNEEQTVSSANKQYINRTNEYRTYCQQYSGRRGRNADSMGTVYEFDYEQ
ncbi:MAG: hypothetical protein ACLTE2_05720 [Eubacteriales bacterium]